MTNAHEREQVAELLPLYPSGTNSTFFTRCCRVAICDDERRCPLCNMLVVGYDEPAGACRHNARWRHAYRGGAV